MEASDSQAELPIEETHEEHEEQTVATEEQSIAVPKVKAKGMSHKKMEKLMAEDLNVGFEAVKSVKAPKKKKPKIDTLPFEEEESTHNIKTKKPKKGAKAKSNPKSDSGKENIPSASPQTQSPEIIEQPEEENEEELEFDKASGEKISKDKKKLKGKPGESSDEKLHPKSKENEEKHAKKVKHEGRPSLQSQLSSKSMDHEDYPGEEEQEQEKQQKPEEETAAKPEKSEKVSKVSKKQDNSQKKEKLPKTEKPKKPKQSKSVKDITGPLNILTEEKPSSPNISTATSIFSKLPSAVDTKKSLADRKSNVAFGRKSKMKNLARSKVTHSSDTELDSSSSSSVSSASTFTDESLHELHDLHESRKKSHVRKVLPAKHSKSDEGSDGRKLKTVSMATPPLAELPEEESSKKKKPPGKEKLKAIVELDNEDSKTEAAKGAGGKLKRKPSDKSAKKTPPKSEEQKKFETEMLAAKKAEEEHQKFLEERKVAVNKEKQEISEQQWRNEQLESTFLQMDHASKALWNVYAKEKIKDVWDQYLVCDGLPNPSDVAAMNTYLHLWEKETPTVTVAEATKRSEEAITLLSKLQDFIDDPFDEPAEKQKDWLWIRNLFRNHQTDNVEFCTYRLLRDIKNNLNRIAIPTADYVIDEPSWSVGLYVWVTLPTPVPNPRMQSRGRIQLSYPHMAMDVQFPSSVRCDQMAIRCAYLKYDHLSDTSHTFPDPPLDPMYTKNLLSINETHHYLKMKYKYDNRKKEVQENGTSEAIAAEVEPEYGPDCIPPPVPYQKLEVSASANLQKIIEEEWRFAKQRLEYELNDHTVNLRKYVILGGIYQLDLYHQPPQPQGMVSYEVFMSTLIEPHTLIRVPFTIQYTPPAPLPPGARRTPEEIEEELLQQEKELDELIFIKLDLPKHVFFLDVPQVVVWDDKEQSWVNNKIHDYKHIEEKGYCTFRLGTFASFAFSTLRWLNLPYQAWEIRPEKDGSVTFILTAAILTLEFHITGHKICLKDIQNAPNEAFNQYLDIYFKFPKLKRIMKEIGIDVFPYFDTFNFVEGTCEKLFPIEDHTYFCMAAASVVYDLTWSRWNATVQDSKKIVFQMRIHLHDKPKQPNFDLVLVTEARTMYVDCTEVSAEFSDAPIEGTKFCADMLHMIKMTTSMANKSRMMNADMAMIKTLHTLFRETRFLSFS